MFLSYRIHVDKNNTLATVRTRLHAFPTLATSIFVTPRFFNISKYSVSMTWVKNAPVYVVLVVGHHTRDLEHQGLTSGLCLVLFSFVEVVVYTDAHALFWNGTGGAQLSRDLWVEIKDVTYFKDWINVPAQRGKIVFFFSSLPLFLASEPCWRATLPRVQHTVHHTLETQKDVGEGRGGRGVQPAFFIILIL